MSAANQLSTGVWEKVTLNDKMQKDAPVAHGDPDELSANQSASGLTALIPIETEQPLSRSILWQLQRRYFHDQGVEAWRTATVPHYVTNNPALASAYAELVLGYLRDLAASSPDHKDHETLYIIELGAGSGRFAHQFLTAFLGRHRRSSQRERHICYVMTDFTETNLAYWDSHDTLRGHVAQGYLDFARFDADCDTELRLIHRGITLRPASLSQPLIVFANYVFDGIRHDAFLVSEGQLAECVVSVQSPDPEFDLASPDRLAHLSVSYGQRPASPDYYPEPELNAILSSYLRTEEPGLFLFPCAALRCIDRLAALSSGRLLLLSGDRGGTQATLDGMNGIGMLLHGSFSLPVNYHVISEYVALRNGVTISTSYQQTHLHVVAFLLGERFNEFCETRLAYDSAFEHAGPEALFSIRKGIERHYGTLALDELFAIIRASHYDPRIVSDCLEVLWLHVVDMDASTNQEVRRMIKLAWTNYYHLGEPHDTPFSFAMLLYRLGDYAAARQFFERSRDLYGESPQTAWNIGLCNVGLGQLDAAAQCFANSMQLDPSFLPEGALQSK